MDSEPIRPQGRLRLASFLLVPAAAVVVAGVLLSGWQTRKTGFTASSARLTVGPDTGASLHEVSRQDHPDVYYRVVLVDAPVGQKLALGCDWIDPSGRVAAQNHYQTQAIVTPQWATHCHQPFGPESPAGTWTVRMVDGARTLCSDTFSVH